ncbi:S8 family serine peptidase [Actinomadura kijaniata]|uniref:S8 family serine peptidase n=1 Tax=Actinomadura kijaniata TaxID=46161 RepID=UPI0009FFD806|nr:S8 family serine peptidase [Actinomadura kijaniata]
MRRWAKGTAALAAAMAVAPPYGAGTAHAAPPTAPDKGGRATVTLITGDRVHVREDAGGRPLVRIEPGAGREKVAFYRRSRGGELSVVPADAAPLVAAGRLDAALFDVTRLLRDGYGDGARPDIPLIVAGTPARRAAAPAGGTVTRPLAALNGAAVAARKDRAASVWASVRSSLTGGATAASGTGRVWLDGRVRATLDRSVPRIGAPSAWRAGYTGKGVTVGVLDSGIDAAHPDLAGSVVAERDFTGSGDVRDRNGHGTHVASTITGDGVADPRYRGVAPDARLVVGKVLDENAAGSFSGVIAGMEWIAQQGVRVVNMSIGASLPSDGTDPLSAAVDALTARTGTLFVVGAGNAGGDGSVTAPGLAEAALTVGAADADDGVAGFSSRGPRPGDGAVKPDVTAPGVDITAARAGGTSAGDPVGDRYTTMSGTSMAAPHAAGAAALLFQRHPGWKPAQVKSALMTTARPAEGASVFAQGAGRIDVGRAVAQRVLADRGGVSFDLRRAGASQRVTFRNEGDVPVRLDLALRMRGPDGPAPDGMFSVSPAVLEIPAGGTADATVTAEPGQAPRGRYEGGLTARRGDEETLRLPVGAVWEPALREVRLAGVDRTGRPAGTTVETTPWAVLTDLATGRQAETYISGSGVAARVPAGRYSLHAVVPTGDTDMALFSYPDLSVGDRDLTITADARRARRVAVRVDSRTAVRAGTDEIGVTETVAGTPLSFGVAVAGTVTGLSARPTAKVAGRPFGFYHVANLAEPDGPRAYHLQHLSDGRIPRRLERRVRDAELAAVDSAYHGDRPLTGRRETVARVPGVLFGAGYGEYPVRLPGRRTELYTASSALRWSRVLSAGQDEGEGFLISGSDPSTGEPGRTAHRWNAAAPGTVGGGVRKAANGPMAFRTSPFATADATGYRSHPTTARTSLWRNGELLGSSDSDTVQVPTPPGEARYTLRSTAERAASWTGLGTRSETEWKFPYTPTMARMEEPPLFVVRTEGDFDQDNRAPSGGRFALALRVTDGRLHSPGTPPRFGRPSVEASYDDGRTWHPAEVTTAGDNRWRAGLTHPPLPGGHVSLRVRLSDGEGTSLDQTVIRAYGLR